MWIQQDDRSNIVSGMEASIPETIFDLRTIMQPYSTFEPWWSLSTDSSQTH